MFSCIFVSKSWMITFRKASMRAKDEERSLHAVLNCCNANRQMAVNVCGWLTKWCLTCMHTVNLTHSRRQCGDSQSAEHVSLVADCPQRNHVHAALSCTRQDGHITQCYRRNFLPWSCGGQFTLPVKEENHNAHWSTAIPAAKDSDGVGGASKEPTNSG